MNSDQVHLTASIPSEGRIRMDPEVKARWVAALRSGEYQQARMRLRNGDAMCCLGVLCNLYDPSQWDDFAYGAELKTGLPTAEVMRWAGFEPYNGSPYHY